MAKHKHERASRQGKKYWQEEVNNLTKSGMTVAVYSRDNGVKAEQLYKWKRRLMAGRKTAANRFIELPLTASVSQSVESYDIYLRPAPHIQVGASFNLETLKRLVEALRGL